MAGKARFVERGAMLDANAAVRMPAHIDDVEQVQRASAGGQKVGAEPSGVA